MNERLEVVDFDGYFHQKLEKWARARLAAGERPEALEARMPDVYLQFVNEPAPFLQGISPAAYFSRVSDPDTLIDALCRYEDAGVSAPELLTRRLTDLGQASVKPLLALMNDDSKCPCLRVTAINLLGELEAREAIPACLKLIDGRAADDEMADAAAELLENLGPSVAESMLERLAGASPEALETYLDLLCNFPGDERIYQYTVKQFLTSPDRRALYASELGKLGDDRAIQPLKRALDLADLNYLDYIEICNAIEMLGGDAGARDREFAGDPYYESLRNL